MIGDDEPRSPAPQPDVTSLWSSREARQRVFETLLATWNGEDAERLIDIIGRIDQAIVARLVAIDLPRLVDARVSLVAGGQHWLARWDGINGELLLAGDTLRKILPLPDGPEEILRGWVHESLHARRPFAQGAVVEYQRVRGYEEGVVTGLADLIMERETGTMPGWPAFPYYVSAYRSLAALLEVGVEVLWRTMWAWAPGTMRAAFLETIEGIRALTPAQRDRLGGIADRLFAYERGNAQPNEEEMRRLWLLALT